MQKRRISESIPLTMAFLSGLIFFNNPGEAWVDNIVLDIALMALIAFSFLMLSIIYGNIHVKKYGKNIVIFLGVTISSLLALVQFVILFMGVGWSGAF
ncbi:MAG: hypothetical protein KZQ83_08900 [gamma proteobacterium symbiont of Taylorina sp.]|nr:hypothetical protein [gamma proteobacterium symbiont of Taylorina sp.]